MTLGRGFDGQPLPETGPLLVVLCRPLSHYYLPKRFDYCVYDCYLELRLHSYAQWVFPSWHNVELVPIPLSQRPSP